LICIFANVPPQTQVDLLNAQLGLDLTTEDLMRSGERAWNLKRAINNRMGLTRANDKLPKAFLEPYKEGGAAGFTPDLQAMLAAYYQARGWDWETGKPTREKLVELGLEIVVKDLWG
jgi:aldehyde:ferredoxin oxidoreductase